MRIGVDGRALAGGRGVSRYTRAMLGALAEGFPADEIVVLVPGSDAVSVPPGTHEQRTRMPGRVIFGAGAIAGRPRLERLLGQQVDVIWLPAPVPVALGGDTPYVATVHDLSWVQRPGDFTAYERLWHRLGRLRALVEGAAAVVAVSGATRDVLVEQWGVSGVEVVRQGVWRPDGREVSSATAATPARYVLAVGALEPRKAPLLLASAHARARAQGLDAELVFAGDGRLADELSVVDGVSVLGAVDGDRLHALYKGATVVASASWLEGFGLPPLEALARGIAPIVSNLPVYDETLGDGALRFAPGDEDGLAAGLVALAGEPALRERVVAAGQAAIAPLTWERAATNLHGVLERAAK